MTMTIEVRQVEANGLSMCVATAGDRTKPPVLLLHGFPHTWFLWRNIIPRLARDHRVIAPDLRGLGGTTRAREGYDLHTLAADSAALLDALDARRASVAGIDLGAPVAWMLAMRHPEHVRKLVVMESLLGRMPGAEEVLQNGPPWWFGFHGIPDFAESVIAGREAEYLDYFFANGTFEHRGIGQKARDAFVAAYSGRESLRCAFAHYRAMPGNGAQIAEMLAGARVTVPTLAIGGSVIGDSLAKQLAPVTDDLETAIVADAAHMLPEDQPTEIARLLTRFFAD